MSVQTDLSETSSTGSPTTPNRACTDGWQTVNKDDSWIQSFPIAKEIDWLAALESEPASVSPSPPSYPSLNWTPLPLSRSPSIWSDRPTVSQDDRPFSLEYGKKNIWRPFQRPRRFSFVDHGMAGAVDADDLWPWRTATMQANGNGDLRQATRRHSVASPYFVFESTKESELEPKALRKDVQAQIDKYFGATAPKHAKDMPLATCHGKSLTACKAALYRIEFKDGRTEIGYVHSSNRGVLHPQLDDWVIVEADRGHDMGKVVSDQVSINETIGVPKTMQSSDQHLLEQSIYTASDDVPSAKELCAKRLYRLATREEVISLSAKNHSETQALHVCRSKTKQKRLPMEVVSAEYQWDRRKLTFYFVADQRIDFRELVRDLFKIYKTRIWMCAISTI